MLGQEKQTKNSKNKKGGLYGENLGDIFAESK